MANMRSTVVGPPGGAAVTGAPGAAAGARGVEPPEAEAAGAAELRELLDALRGADRLIARAVGLAGRLAGSGVAEQVEGLPLDVLVGLACGLPHADRRTLVGAGEILAGMPHTAGLFTDGTLSWGQVRRIVAAARRLPARARAALDARVGAAADAWGLEGLDPDQVVDAVDRAVDDLRDPRNVERAEQRRAEASFVSVQTDFAGGARLYAELDPLTAAVVVGALDAAAGRPTADDGEPDTDGATDGDQPPDSAAGDDGAGGTGPGWSGTARGRQYAAALERICAEWLGGGAGRRARPLLVAHVDLATATRAAAGTAEVNVRGPLPSLTARTIEALARSADVKAVVFDGARPLAVTRKLSAADIPADVRFAVRARDRGCRWPGSQDPIGHTDIHHTIEQARGGDHHPDRLVCYARRRHTSGHRHGWHTTIDPDTGTVTITRGRRRWRSLPRGTPLPQPPPQPDHDPDPF